MTSYTINDKYVGINIGTFIAIGNTVSFTNGVKDGWVLCDGEYRANTNNRFGKLITMGIGYGTDFVTGGHTGWYPPSLNGKIMMGATCTGSNLGINNNDSGQTNNQVTLAVSKLPSHSHTISLTDSTHTHSYVDITPIYESGFKYGESAAGGSPFLGILQRTTNEVNDAHTHIVTISSVINSNGTALSSGSTLNNSFSIKNSAFHIQWIVKYA